MVRDKETGHDELEREMTISLDNVSISSSKSAKTDGNMTIASEEGIHTALGMSLDG